MSSEDGRLSTNPLFLGLTRSALILGVSFMFFGLNTMGCIFYFILTSDFRIVLVGVVVHGFGMVLTKKEPLAVEMLLTRIQKIGFCKNKQFHGNLDSYDMF